MNAIRKLAFALALSQTYAMQAFAALPASVQTDIDAAKTDGTGLAYSLLGLAIAVGVIMWLKRRAG